MANQVVVAWEELVIVPLHGTDADTIFHSSQTPHYLFLEVTSVLALGYWALSCHKSSHSQNFPAHSNLKVGVSVTLVIISSAVRLGNVD